MSATTNDIGHDQHLYDPDRHDNQIVAVFADRAAADRAVAALREVGLPADAIQVMSQPEAEPAATELPSAGDQILGAFMSLFSSGTENRDYAHAVGRGHAMVVVSPPAGIDRHLMVQTLERCEPVDFDAKLEEWRQAGYEGQDEPQAAERRVGRREPTEAASRVRSYIADRPGNTLGTGGDVTNATPGATTSGANAPRR